MHAGWWQAWGVWVAIAVSVVAGLVGFVYHDGQRDQHIRAIEARLERDETEYRTEYRALTEKLNVQDIRIRSIELDTTARLTRIETRLETIDAYMMRITELLSVRTEAAQTLNPQRNRHDQR